MISSKEKLLNMRADTLINQVALRNNTTPEAVKQEMQSAIDHAWENGTLKKLYGEKPSVEAFLYMTAFQTITT